jgi:outer membrane receptor protein involved in Fe transport
MRQESNGRSGAGSLRKQAMILAASAALSTLAMAARAQQAPRPQPADQPNSGAQLEEVLVTATRLTTAGFDTPTPTQVLDIEQLEQSAHPNIFETVEQLPALMGSRGTRVGNGGTSEGLNGLSSFSTRGLAPIRTLTLVDGQRIAPANINGSVDVSLLPQLLIQRVDVVTGGASASYGSDAVGGVVNFITNRRFSGFKANIQAGSTNYSDGKNSLLQAAVGHAFMDNRLHVALSGEYYDNKGIPAREPGDNGGPNGRTWFQAPAVGTRTIAQTPAGTPQYRLFIPAQYNTFSAYGLITAGPLAGTAFGAGGTPYTFQRGTGCIAQYCLGGENSGNVLITASFDEALRREVGYSRVSYDLNANTELYATVSLANVTALDQPNAGARREANLTIQCDNAFLPQVTKTACTANNITSFQFGVSNQIFPGNVTVAINRRQPRYVVGLNASNFNMLGKPWNLQTNFEYGATNINIDITNVTLIPRYLAAIDAVTVNGVAVCRNLIARNSGCVPFNVIGNNAVNPTAWNYIAPAQGPQVRTNQRESAFALSLSGAPFKNWAGDVSMAFGVEYRLEAYRSRADWYGGGQNGLSPVGSDFPADPVLSANGANWYAGNFNNGSGTYDVKEGFVELGMPLFNNRAGKFDFNIAGRQTNYSTSGSVTTWKVGGVWDTPLTGVRLRGVRSRDVRAPNLSELFAAPISQNATVTDRRTINGVANRSVSVNQSIVGNPALVPEESDNTEGGIVYRPAWLPGFSTSLDFYDIKIAGGIASLTNQQIVDLCQIGNNADACKSINLDGGVAGTANASFVIIQPFNLAAISTRGFDLEAAYNFNFNRLNIPGRFNIRGLLTHVNSFVSNTGIPGQPILHYAGNNSNLGAVGYNNGDFGITPNWKGLFSQSWDGEKLSFTLTERYVSAGFMNPDWIECQAPNCPVPTLQNPTVDSNRLPSATYFDLGGKLTPRPGLDVYFKVDNIANKSPPPMGNSALYDWFGRVYRLGLRFSP